MKWPSWIGAAVVALAIVAGGTYATARGDRARDRAEQRAIDRVNTVCGERPVRAAFHGSGWSNRPWWEVQCPDGTSAVVSVR